MQDLRRNAVTSVSSMKLSCVFIFVLFWVFFFKSVTQALLLESEVTSEMER